MPEINHERLPNREAIASFNGKVLLTTQHYAELKAYEHALAFTVARIADKDMLTEVHKAMKQAIENGTNFADFKKQLRPYLMAKGWLAPNFKNDNVDDDKETFRDYQKYLGHRLRTIYHTGKATAYAGGQWERIQRTKELLPYLQYMKSASTNKRDEHKQFYGMVRPVDDPIWASIMPPNGFGCKCWVKQLTKTRAQKILNEQAEKGIVYDIEMEQVKHPLTGEMMTVPKGVHFSFNHNHDRMTALLKLAQEKHGVEFSDRLKKEIDSLMLDLIFQPNFTRDMLTVGSVSFTTRFNELQSLAVNGNRKNSMELRKAHAKGEVWAVATISPQIQKSLDVGTAIIWLSDDTIIKMLAHHPELDLLPLFKDVQMILKNAVMIVKDGDSNVVYYSVNDKHYKTAIKSTRDKKELYLTTIFKMNEKDFYKDMARQERRGKEILE